MRSHAFMLWLQGWAHAPPVALAARSSFERMNPTWELTLLDANNYVEYIPADRRWIVELEPQIPAAAFSDLVRAELLRANGGVWVDATVVSLRPLDEWLPLAMTGGFFGFRNPGPDRPLSTWFLASEPGHLIISAWADAAECYWRDRTEPDEYHWFHYAFRELLETNPNFSAAWSEVPDLPADAPHHLLPHRRRLVEPPTAADAEVFVGDAAPVLKLTHKLDVSFSPDSNHEVVIQAGSTHLMHAFPVVPAASLRIGVTGEPGERFELTRRVLEHAGHSVIEGDGEVCDVDVRVEKTGIEVEVCTSVPCDQAIRMFRLPFVDGYLSYPDPAGPFGEVTLRALLSVVRRIGSVATGSR